jgi:acetyltransferase
LPIHNLDKLFYPGSVAVVGATNQGNEPGNFVMHNLLQGGFEGPIMPVTDREQAIAGVLAYPRVDALPITPDLAVVCSPPPELPEVIRALGERGTRAAIVLGDGRGQDSVDICCPTMLSEAERYGLRVLGPDCFGLMVPHIGLNASVSHVPALSGGVAFVSQSVTVCTAVLDWARDRDIGFSHFVSLGKTADICFGDVIDFLGNDAMTRAILLDIENIRSGRSFMSAGRGASRNKPILVIKAGRTSEGQRAACADYRASGNDAVYDAAIRRAGMLRVAGLDELFSAVETLGRIKPLRGERLGIVANGRAIAAMAVDTLIDKDGRLAAIGDATVESLRKTATAAHLIANPIILNEEASPEQYGIATMTLLQAGEMDAVMVLHAPISGVSSTKAAEAVAQVARKTRGAVLTSWMGGQRVAEGRRLFAEAHLPTYDTPNQAVDAFMHMVGYRRNQVLLMETPASTEFTPATDRARRLAEDFLLRGRSIVSGTDALALLATYGVGSVDAREVHSPQQAAVIAAEIGCPVTLTLLTSEKAGKTGQASALFLDTPDAVKAAAERLQSEMLASAPRTRIEGFLVEPVFRHTGVLEAKVGVADDPVFGPVITFGQGGTAGDLMGDSVVGLPPLNMNLAREMISRTRISKLLQTSGDAPAAMQALCLTLVQLSQLIVDMPEVAALDINPLVVDHRGVVAVDAQILIARPTEASQGRLAIRPYPKELEEEFVLPNGLKVLLRPIRPEDAPAQHEFHDKCTPQDMQLRFFHSVRTLSHLEMARLTQVDYDREMAFIATTPKEDGSGWETFGTIRTFTDLHNEKAEYAILVRSDIKRQQLGRKLMEKMVRYCRSRGTRQIVGQVLCNNRSMLDLIGSLGFKSKKVLDENIMEVVLDLQPPLRQPDA